jgi:hypothetical protein
MILIKKPGGTASNKKGIKSIQPSGKRAVYTKKGYISHSSCNDIVFMEML